VGENQSMSEQPELIIHPTDFPVFLKARMMGLSVAEFAEKLEVTPKYIYMLLKGERPPSDAILKKVGLEVYYGVPTKKGKK
jgi:transcriptional regulator with XRE-family HTH domain